MILVKVLRCILLEWACGDLSDCEELVRENYLQGIKVVDTYPLPVQRDIRTSGEEKQSRLG